MELRGVWVPVITPFLDGNVDEASLRSLVEQLIADGVSGLVAVGTTGECPTIGPGEHTRVAGLVVDAACGRVPVLVGAGGPDTRHALELMQRLEDVGVDGFLSVCPYYSRPNQTGLRAHFDRLASATQLPIVLYNIPHRTGVNLENATARALMEHDNIVGIKDCCRSLGQSMELLGNRRPGFAVLTGDDEAFFVMLTLGADGGILAAAHHETRSFVALWQQMRNNDHVSARARWGLLAEMVTVLFSEPNPVALKQLLFAQGRIRSPEVRLPLVGASCALKARLHELLTDMPNVCGALVTEEWLARAGAEGCQVGRRPGVRRVESSVADNVPAQ